jgi:hypothetical protein
VRPLPYLQAYPETTRAQVQTLLDEGRVAQWLINKIFGRRATQTELQRIVEYVGIGATDEQIRWELVSQNLLISSESIYGP